MRGDFVLYRGSKTNPFEAAIMYFSKGPFCHTEIDMGDGTFIGEHGKGLTRHSSDRVGVLVSPFGRIITNQQDAGIEAGLAWVEQMYAEDVKNNETHEYGWWDLISAAAKFVGLHIILRLKVGDWDCSDFVTRYLVVAGAAGPLGTAAETPETVSPNDLGRAFNVK
jgi:hypothetical protein